MTEQRLAVSVCEMIRPMYLAGIMYSSVYSITSASNSALTGPNLLYETVIDKQASYLQGVDRWPHVAVANDDSVLRR